KLPEHKLVCIEVFVCYFLRHFYQLLSVYEELLPPYCILLQPYPLNSQEFLVHFQYFVGIFVQLIQRPAILFSLHFSINIFPALMSQNQLLPASASLILLVTLALFEVKAIPSSLPSSVTFQEQEDD